MNINSIIEEAFKDFEVAGKHIPIAFLNYTGNENTYLIYYTWLERPECFADDINQSESAFATIDIFSKGNFKGILKQVKKVLRENGFVWTDNSAEIYEAETGFYHIAINFTIAN